MNNLVKMSWWVLLAIVSLSFAWSSNATSLFSCSELQSNAMPAKFIGESSSNDFQEALDKALLQASLFYQTLGSDIRYYFKVIRTTGQQGSILGEQIVRVKIATCAEI